MAAVILCSAAGAPSAAQTLEAIRDSAGGHLRAGPTSGQFICPANGRMPPFLNRQPVQGVSSVLRTANGDFLVMSDNGFGAKANSADYVLRVYRISPDFRTTDRRTGSIKVESFISLHDPDHQINFPIVADGDDYPASGIPVEQAIRDKRLLTGGDFDIESVREAHDGTFWFGDEFGPFLLHTDATGKVLEAPFPLPGVRSPQNPVSRRGHAEPAAEQGLRRHGDHAERQDAVSDARGIADHRSRSAPADHQRVRPRAPGATPGNSGFTASMRRGGQAIGDFTAFSDREFLIIESDNIQGRRSSFKKIFLVDLDDVDPAGFLVKHEVADLLAIAIPTTSPARLGLHVSVCHDRERDSSERTADRRSQRQQLPVQQRPHAGRAGYERVHHPQARSSASQLSGNDPATGRT